MRSDLDEVIAVTQGDCRNTQALMETLELKGTKIFAFSYPYDRDEEPLHLQIKKMMIRFGVTEAEIGYAKMKLDMVRRKQALIDRLTWQAGTVS